LPDAQGATPIFLATVCHRYTPAAHSVVMARLLKRGASVKATSLVRAWPPLRPRRSHHPVRPGAHMRIMRHAPAASLLAPVEGKPLSPQGCPSY
jgi:hypothetical protein